MNDKVPEAEGGTGIYSLCKPGSNEVTESCKTLILCKLKRLGLFLTNVFYRNGQSVFTDLYRLHNHW